MKAGGSCWSSASVKGTAGRRFTCLFKFNVHWINSKRVCKQSMRLLECVQDNYLIHKLKELEEKHYWTWCSSMQIRLLKRLRLEAVWDIVIMPWMTSSSWGIRVWQGGEAGLWTSEGPFKELVEDVPWETLLKDKGAEQSQQFFENIFLRAQELSIPQLRKHRQKTSMAEQGLAVQTEGQETHRQRKRTCMDWEEYRAAMQTCKDGIRNDKTQMEMNLISVQDNSEKGFCRCFSKKRKARENVALW